MATVAGYAITVRSRGAETRTPPPNGVVASVDQDLSRHWASGSSAGQVDTVYDVAGTATDTPTVIACDALPSMTGGSARDMGRLMVLTIANTGAAALLIGGGTTPVLAQQSIPAGGALEISFAASGADGLDVSTNKNISIECATSTTYRLSLAGRTVA